MSLRDILWWGSSSGVPQCGEYRIKIYSFVYIAKRLRFLTIKNGGEYTPRLRWPQSIKLKPKLSVFATDTLQYLPAYLLYAKF